MKVEVLKHGWHLNPLTVQEGKASWRRQVLWRFCESSKTLANKTNHQGVVWDKNKNKGIRSKVNYRHREL